MFFSGPGKYDPCGMFSKGHYILLTITIIIVIILAFLSRKCDENRVKKIIRISTLFLWVLEIIKIIFNFVVGNGGNPNNYIPLYYCSLILYAGLLSGFAHGKLKRIGDIFIVTGSIIGGMFFLFCPNTSLPVYPMFHYISIQSFIFHGTMLYLGILVNITNYINLKHSDIKYYAILILLICSISLVINKILKTNFMFISNNFPNTPVETLYYITGKLFTISMILIQVFGPFYIVYFLKFIISKIVRKNRKLIID